MLEPLKKWAILETYHRFGEVRGIAVRLHEYAASDRERSPDFGRKTGANPLVVEILHSAT